MLLTLLALSCVRVNPAFSDAGSTGGGADGTAGDSAGPASSGAVTTAGGDAGASVGTTGMGEGTSGSTTGDLLRCGDGVLDPGEACDDGDDEPGDACSPECRLPWTVEWETRWTPNEGPTRFFGATRVDDNLFVTGRALRAGGAVPTPIAARFDLSDGAFVQSVDVGGFAEGEGLEIAVGDGQLFVAGEHGDLQNQSGFLAALTFDDIGGLEPTWTRDVLGTRSNGVSAELTGVMVTVGEFSVRGHGLARYDLDGTLQWEWIRTTEPRNASQVFGLGGRDELLLVAAMIDTNAVVAQAVDAATGMFDPIVTASGTGTGDDAAQVVHVVSDGFIAAGYLVGEDTGRDAWIARYGTAGELRWRRVFNGGSDDRDEIEDVAVLASGDVVAVGMLGEPPVPTVWRVDDDDGSVRSEVGFKDPAWTEGFFRAVDVAGDEIFIAGERRQGEDGSVGVGIVARLVPG